MRRYRFGKASGNRFRCAHSVHAYEWHMGGEPSRYRTKQVIIIGKPIVQRSYRVSFNWSYVAAAVLAVRWDDGFTCGAIRHATGQAIPAREQSMYQYSSWHD